MYAYISVYCRAVHLNYFFYCKSYFHVVKTAAFLTLEKKIEDNPIQAGALKK